MDRIFVIVAILAGLALIGIALFLPGGGGGATGNGTATKAANIDLQHQSFSPDRVTLQHGRVKLVLTNQSNVLHQIEIYDPVSDRVIHREDIIRPGQSKTVWVDLQGGVIGERRYELYDPVFRNKGMEAVLIVR